VPWVTRIEATAALLLALAVPACSGGPPPPSVLLVTIDTLRRDHVGAYGDDRGLTPRFDALAAEGLLHENAYTTMPTTGPAHLSALTGLYPSQLGSRRNGEPLAPQFSSRDLAQRLSQRGYATAAFVTTRLVANAATGLRGFEIYDAPRSVLRPGDDAVSAALAWLDVEKRRPVFVWLHLYDPHAPYGTADEKGRSFPVDRTRYGFVDRDYYASRENRRAMEERYARGVQSADAALGRILDGMRERLGTRLFVLVAADHGESLAEHLEERGFAYDHGQYLDPEEIEIPLIVVGPGIAPGRSRGAASLRDVYTTILGVSGAGDPDASSEDRRDLRLRDDARRVVRIERRAFVAAQPDSVRAHGAAAADGARIVIIAEDGSSPDAADPRAADLLEAARSGLDPRAADATPAEISSETREALRDLGYAE
jgi:membrane-anchored protein YejM (alkaline phosphatase superfamily)